MVSLSETVEMEVHQLLKGDVDTGLVCLSGADLDELVEANRALELENRALRSLCQEAVEAAELWISCECPEGWDSVFAVFEKMREAQHG